VPPAPPISSAASVPASPGFTSAAGTASVPPPASGTTQNISSNEIERNEVQEIAAQLKQQLDSPQTPAAPQPTVAPKPDKPPEPVKKTEHLVDLQSPHDQDDTIFIDRDGSFRQVKTGQTPSASSKQS
jgi:hypothetical protein